MEDLAMPAAPPLPHKSFFDEVMDACTEPAFTRPMLDAAETMKRHSLKLHVPKVDVTQQEGYFCHINAMALINLPPDVVYDVLTHPDNHAIFRSQKECAYRNVLSVDGDMMEVEVEHTATWNFMFLSGVFHTRTIVHQSKSAGTVEYTMTRPTPVLKRFKGSWTLDPCIPPEGTTDQLWTLMTLDQDMHPAMIPPPPTDRLLRKMLGGQIRAMFDDMCKEFAAIAAGTPQLTYPPDPYKLINAEPLQPHTPPPPPERSSSLLAPSSPLTPPTPPNSVATPSLPSTASSSSTHSPRTPQTPAKPHPLRPLASPTHLPAAEATAAAAALAASMPAVARLAPNLTAHSIDISNSDVESSDSEWESDEPESSAAMTTTTITAHAPRTPFASHPQHPAHMGHLSESLESFYSCSAESLDDTPIDAPPLPHGAATATRPVSGVTSGLWARPWGKAAGASGHRYGSVMLQELGEWVTYLWGRLPDTGVLGFTAKVAKMAAAGVLTRVLGPPGADMFVSWAAAAGEEEGREEGAVVSSEW